MRPRRVVLTVAIAVALAGTAWVLVSKSGATRDYAPFKHCPLDDPATDICLFTQTEHGELTVGKKTVRLSETMTLQGGARVVRNRKGEIVRDELISATNGETLSRTPQSITGGLRAVVDPGLLTPGSRRVFDGLIEAGKTGVTARIELVGPVSSIYMNVQNLVEGQGIALILPVRVKFSNAFLGESCYIGSIRRPVSLRLTTGRTDPPGPNSPIEGRVGKAKFEDDYNLTILRGSSLVSNTFAGPATTGCGGARSPQVNRAVSAGLGLPAAAGHNTAILDGTLQIANAPAVRTSA